MSLCHVRTTIVLSLKKRLKVKKNTWFQASKKVLVQLDDFFFFKFCICSVTVNILMSKTSRKNHWVISDRNFKRLKLFLGFTLSEVEDSCYSTAHLMCNVLGTVPNIPLVTAVFLPFLSGETFYINLCYGWHFRKEWTSLSSVIQNIKYSSVSNCSPTWLENGRPRNLALI